MTAFVDRLPQGMLWFHFQCHFLLGCGTHTDMEDVLSLWQPHYLTSTACVQLIITHTTTTTDNQIIWNFNLNYGSSIKDVCIKLAKNLLLLVCLLFSTMSINQAQISKSSIGCLPQLPRSRFTPLSTSVCAWVYVCLNHVIISLWCTYQTEHIPQLNQVLQQLE